MFSRIILRAPSAYSAAPLRATRAFCTQDKFNKREKAEEDKAIRAHELELLKKLQRDVEDLQAEKKAREAVEKQKAEATREVIILFYLFSVSKYISNISN